MNAFARKNLAERIRVRRAAPGKFPPPPSSFGSYFLRRLPVRKLFLLVALAALAGCQTQPEKPTPVVTATGGENDGKPSVHRAAHHAEPTVIEPKNVAPVAPDNLSTNKTIEKPAALPFPPDPLRSNSSDSKNTNADSKAKISIPAAAPPASAHLAVGNATAATKPPAERISITVPAIAPVAPPAGTGLTLAEPPLPSAVLAPRKSAIGFAPPLADFWPARPQSPVVEIFSRVALSPVAFGFQDRRASLIFSLAGLQIQTAGAPAVSALCLSNWLAAPDRPPVPPPASHASPDARDALHRHLYQFLLGDHR